MLSLAWVPRMACQKSISITYSRSPPFSGSGCACCGPPLPPKNCEKISRYLPRYLLEELREDIAEAAGIGAPAARELIGKIESVEIHSRVRIGRARRGPGESALGIETVLVVHLALLGVAENVVGFLHFLETIFGGLVPRIQIRVVFARQFAIGFADVIRRGFARYAQRFVIVVLGRRGHACP